MAGPQQAIVCCWTGTGASIAANKVPGRAGRPLRRRADGRRRPQVERRQRARAQPPGRLPRAELGEILDAWFDVRAQPRCPTTGPTWPHLSEIETAE